LRKTGAKNCFKVAFDAAVLLTALIAATGLLGWVFDVRTLKSVVPSLTTMKANTAVCFALTAAALWLSRTAESRRRNAAAVCILAFAVIGIAAVTLGEYAFGVNTGLDELLFRDVEHAGTAYPPGRFAPGTGACFLLLAAALLSLDAWPRIAHGFTLAAALVALIGLIGYLYNLPTLYGAGRYISLALHTVIGFLALTTGLVAARPDRGIAALIAEPQIRPLIAGALLLPLALGSVAIAGQRLGWYGGEFSMALFSVLLIVLTVALVWTTAIERQRIEGERLKARRDLVQLNLELESRVARRTAELEAANTDLENANRELEAFSYTASHDLRAPLRSLDGFSQFLLEDYGDKLNEEGRSYLERIRLNAQRMGLLITDMLALSKVSRAELRRDDVDLSALVLSILEELRESQPERIVEWDIESGVSAAADPRLLRAALENLLGNAWKFTSKTPDARIRFGRVAGAQQPPVYFIADNGAGFDMAYAERMFQPFQRLHRAAEFEGTGIGLATVQRIIHRHGGWIRAEGKVDGGATFFFTLNSVLKRTEHE
jgi:signal transduction histidine kinase